VDLIESLFGKSTLDAGAGMRACAASGLAGRLYGQPRFRPHFQLQFRVHFRLPRQDHGPARRRGGLPRLWAAGACAAPTLRPLAPTPAAAPGTPGAAAVTVAPGTAGTSGASTARDFVNVLGRTEPGMRARVGGQEVPVYATGVFVRDRVPLAPGDNTIAIEVVDPRDAQARTSLALTVQRVPRRRRRAGLGTPRHARRPAAAAGHRPAEPAAAAAAGAWRPASPSRRASTAHPAWWARRGCPAGTGSRSPKSAARPGRYRARLHLPEGPDTEPAPVLLRLRARAGAKLQGPRTVQQPSAAGVGRWAPQGLRLAAWGPKARTSSTACTRCGWAGRTWPSCSQARCCGWSARTATLPRAPGPGHPCAWWRRAAWSGAPKPPCGAPYPVFTTVRVAGGEQGDVVSIPFPAPAPYAVRSVSTADGRTVLEVELYGTHLAATSGDAAAPAPRVVREVTLEQPADERVRVRIAPTPRACWGWRAQQTASGLTLTLRA
jgi:hypothetical protein